MHALRIQDDKDSGIRTTLSAAHLKIRAEHKKEFFEQSGVMLEDSALFVFSCWQLAGKARTWFYNGHAMDGPAFLKELKLVQRKV